MLDLPETKETNNTTPNREEETKINQNSEIPFDTIESSQSGPFSLSTTKSRSQCVSNLSGINPETT